MGLRVAYWPIERDDEMETLKTEDGYCTLPHGGDEEDDTLLFLTDY